MLSSLDGWLALSANVRTFSYSEIFFLKVYYFGNSMRTLEHVFDACDIKSLLLMLLLPIFVTRE